MYVNSEIYKQSLVKGNSVDKFKKLKAREKIQIEVGDIHDLLADLYKRVLFLERLCYKSLKPILEHLTDATYADKAHHLELLTMYNAAIEQEGFKERIDIGSETHAEMIDKLITRSLQITQIINDEYIE